MVPFEVITNSCSRNYRAKSLLAQPRDDASSSARTRTTGRNGGGDGEGSCAYRGEPQRAGPTSTHFEPICYALPDPIDHRGAEPGVASDPERSLRDSIGGAQILVCSVIETFKPRLAGHVPGQEQARFDTICQQMEL